MNDKPANRHRDLLSLIRDDAYAASFQSLGQYRTALLGHVEPAVQGEPLRHPATPSFLEYPSFEESANFDPVPAVQGEPSRESLMVVLERDEHGKPTVWCDPEIADLVSALNGSGVRTIASCSGHGKRPGNIVLADGRELVIARSFEESRIVDSIFQGINGEPARAVVVPKTDVQGEVAVPMSLESPWVLFVEQAAQILDAEQERLSAEGYLMDSGDCIQTLREAAPPAPDVQREPVYLYRRLGLNDFVTCDFTRYIELSGKPSLFETKILYTTPQPAEQQPALDAVEIDPKDLIVQLWSSKPKSGWDYTLACGVKITHVPSSITVTCDTERSTHANKNKALCKLQSRLVGWAAPDVAELQAELERERKRRFDGNEQASREHREDMKAAVSALERIAAKAEALDEGGDGCDDETSRSVAADLRELIAAHRKQGGEV